MKSRSDNITWLELNWDNMLFRMYPDLIVEETLPNYRSSHAVEIIRVELAKSEPNSELLFYLLSGGKYDKAIA